MRDITLGKLAFVDTHIHFWVYDHPDLFYAALQPEATHPQIGPQWDKLKTDFVAEGYIAETRNANVTKAVHVQAALGSKDPVKETEFIQQAADRTGFPLAIVAYSHLAMPNVEEELARHCEFPNMRGIRHFDAAEHLDNPDFHRGYALLEKFNLVHSFNIHWEHMYKTRDLALKFPNIKAVCDHCGFPRERTDEYFKDWQKGISALAEADNVVCKISGLGIIDWNWTVDSIRPWVLHCIEAFGPERCMFGTNWPVDRLFSTHDALIDAYTEIVAGFSQDEQIAMFSGNAEKLYRF